MSSLLTEHLRCSIAASLEKQTYTVSSYIYLVCFVFNREDHCVPKSVWKDILIVVKKMKYSWIKEGSTFKRDSLDTFCTYLSSFFVPHYLTFSALFFNFAVRLNHKPTHPLTHPLTPSLTLTHSPCIDRGRGALSSRPRLSHHNCVHSMLPISQGLRKESCPVF
jgi:hypothetical protein